VKLVVVEGGGKGFHKKKKERTSFIERKKSDIRKKTFQRRPRGPSATEAGGEGTAGGKRAARAVRGTAWGFSEKKRYQARSSGKKGEDPTGEKAAGKKGMPKLSRSRELEEGRDILAKEKPLMGKPFEGKSSRRERTTRMST